MTNPTLDDRIEALRREFGDRDLEDALFAHATRRPGGGKDLLARVAVDWVSDETEYLDYAAAMAAQHEGLSGEEDRLRSWLALLALRGEMARHVAGTPAQLLDDLGRSMVERARIRGEAIRTIWQEPMLTPAAAAMALGARKTNREKVRRQRDRSWLLGLPSDGGYLYPAFQFDPERRGVFAEVRRVNELLEAATDPWGVASWWISVHDGLDARPADLVGTGRADDLVEVAEALLEPIG